MHKTYEAHIIRQTDTLMEIKIHGGDILMVPKIPGINNNTTLVITMEPGASKADVVMTLNKFKSLTGPPVTGEEFIKDTVPVGVDLLDEEWDCSPPVW